MKTTFIPCSCLELIKPCRQGQAEATELEAAMTNAEDSNKDPENKNGGEKTAEAAKVESGATAGIEQKPFLTQTELLIKMKKGEEEEVAR